MICPRVVVRSDTIFFDRTDFPFPRTCLASLQCDYDVQHRPFFNDMRRGDDKQTVYFHKLITSRFEINAGVRVQQIRSKRKYAYTVHHFNLVEK